MKQIKKRAPKISIQLKVVGALIIGCLLLLFFITLNFFCPSSKKIDTLHFSQDLLPPLSNMNGGFYNSAIVLKLQSSVVGTHIYYTIDGSEPSLTSSTYTAPLIIDAYKPDGKKLADIPTSPRWKPPLGDIYRGIVLRAIVVDDKNNKSEELIQSFFLDKEGNKRYSFPVISLCINKEDFFGFNKGIYVMGKKYGDKIIIHAKISRLICLGGNTRPII